MVNLCELDDLSPPSLLGIMWSMYTTIIGTRRNCQLTARPETIRCATLAPCFLWFGLCFWLRLWLSLRSVLPRLRGYGHAINGSPCVAFGAGVRVSAASVAYLPLLGLGLLDEPL